MSNTIYKISSHRLYKTWDGMIQRTRNKNNPWFHVYGGRGITVCDRWKNSSNFIEDMYPTFTEGMTLDRIDNNGNYEPSNCRWVVQSTQTRNSSKIRSTNTSGYRGVSFNKARKKWNAHISINGKSINIGTFLNPIAAAIGYDQYIVINHLEHTKNFT